MCWLEGRPLTFRDPPPYAARIVSQAALPQRARGGAKELLPKAEPGNRLRRLRAPEGWSARRPALRGVLGGVGVGVSHRKGRVPLLAKPDPHRRLGDTM